MNRLLRGSRRGLKVELAACSDEDVDEDEAAGEAAGERDATVDEETSTVVIGDA